MDAEQPDGLKTPTKVLRSGRRLGHTPASARPTASRAEAPGRKEPAPGSRTTAKARLAVIHALRAMPARSGSSSGGFQTRMSQRVAGA